MRRRVIPRLKCDFMKSQNTHGRRDRVVVPAVRPSREINRFVYGNGNENENGTVVRIAGYGGYDLRGFARHAGERTASLIVSRTQSRQTYLNAHTSAHACVTIQHECTRVYMYTHAHMALAEMEDSVVRRYPGGISHREISISAFLSTIPRSRTDYPLIRAGQRREVE